MRTEQYPLMLFVSLLILAILISSCASETLLQSSPSFATVYIDGHSLGSTPHVYSDRKMVSSSTLIMLRKEGYMDFYTNLKRNEKLDVGALVGGIFFIWPLLWLKEYDPVHYYELVKIEDREQDISVPDALHYMVGEDAQLKFTVDSLIITDSLPESIKIDLEDLKLFERHSLSNYRNTPADYNYYTNLGIGNDYLLVYFNLVKKRDLNINFTNRWNRGLLSQKSTGYQSFDKNGIWEQYNDKYLDCFPTTFLKDEFGKSHPAILYRGGSEMIYPGGIFDWNTQNPRFEHKNLDTELLIFRIPKNVIIIQMDFNYQYKEALPKTKQVNKGRIDIDLMLHE